MPTELNIFAFLYLEPEKGQPIEGEAKDASHAGELQIFTFGFGLENRKTDGDKNSKDTKPDFHEMTLTLPLSKASPVLFLAAARKDHFKKATISVKKPGAESENPDFYQIQLSDVYITSYNVAAGDSDRPTDTITLSYMNID